MEVVVCDQHVTVRWNCVSHKVLINKIFYDKKLLIKINSNQSVRISSFLNPKPYLKKKKMTTLDFVKCALGVRSIHHQSHLLSTRQFL